jgi:hypothetical protein
MISVVTRKTHRSDRSRWIATTIRGAAVATLAAAIGLSLGTVAFADRDGLWVSTWGDPAVATVQAPSNQTVREIERISLGGNWLRVRLSNEFNLAAITVGEAHIALAGLAGSTVPYSDRQLKFGGQSSITIPPNAAVYSDPVHLAVPTLGSVAVSLFFSGKRGDGDDPSGGHRHALYH